MDCRPSSRVGAGSANGYSTTASSAYQSCSPSHVPSEMPCINAWTTSRGLAGSAMGLPIAGSGLLGRLGVYDGFMAEHPGEDRIHLREVPGRVEQLGTLGGRERGGDLRIGIEEVDKRARAAPDFHRVALHGGVGVLTRQPLLGQRQQHPLRVHQAAEMG